MTFEVQSPQQWGGDHTCVVVYDDDGIVFDIYHDTSLLTERDNAVARGDVVAAAFWARAYAECVNSIGYGTVADDFIP